MVGGGDEVEGEPGEEVGGWVADFGVLGREEVFALVEGRGDVGEGWEAGE